MADSEFSLGIPPQIVQKTKRGRPTRNLGQVEPVATAPELETLPDEGVNYLHRATRLNNPPAGLAAEGKSSAQALSDYSYNPHRTPTLRYDQSGHTDRVVELVELAGQRQLSISELEELKAFLSVHEPWLEWAGKRESEGFSVDPVALHIHERVSTQAILRAVQRHDLPRGLFGDPGLDPAKELQFYRYRVEWANRLILGDSLQIMASLARRENLAGQVQMIYLDPPYGIKFSSNFQPVVGQKDVKERDSDLPREPEMVRAYRDTWTLGVHSYLGYLRDRLMVAKELLADSGSIFVQISDENLHRVRMLMDEVFGANNFVSMISYATTTSFTSNQLSNIADHVLWYGRDKSNLKFSRLFRAKIAGEEGGTKYKALDQIHPELALVKENELAVSSDLTSQGSVAVDQVFQMGTHTFSPPAGLHWKTNVEGLRRLRESGRLKIEGSKPRYIRLMSDFDATPLSNLWMDIGGVQNRTEGKLYVVQTATPVIERCLLMTTDPGDLVLDPTCGSGTTAYAAEQWGRRWITCDTSRVAISVARQRLMTAKFDYYALRPLNNEDLHRNSSGSWLKDVSTGEALTLNCKTLPHITLGSIARNVDLDPIILKYDPILTAALEACNEALLTVPGALHERLQAKLLTKERVDGKRSVTEADRRRWVLPPNCRDRSKEAKKCSVLDLNYIGWYVLEVPFDTDPDWPVALQDAVKSFRKHWRGKITEINNCISENATQENVVDQPRKVSGVTRVSGPFTVESVLPALESLDLESPISGQDEELPTFEPGNAPENVEAFQEQVLSWLRQQGVDFLNNQHQNFSRLEGLSGNPVLHGQGVWGDPERTVAVSIGPRIGNVTEFQVSQALRQAYQRGFDELVFAGFGFDAVAQGAIQAHAEEEGSVRTHLLLIRPDVAMASLLKDSPGAQLFTAMGLPRTRLERVSGGEFRIHMEGVDIYNPLDHSLVPTGADKVAAWFLDQDYDGRAFCITQAFFPDKTAWDKLARALKSADAERFKAFGGTASLPFKAGKFRRCAVKVIDPRGNEVMATHGLEIEETRA